MKTGRDDVQATHRRETLLYIVLPVVGGGVLLVIALILVMLLPRMAQVSAMSDFFLTIFLLCPAALCMLPLVLLLAVMVYLMNTAQSKTEQAFAKIGAYSDKINEQAQAGLNKAAAVAIDANARFAPFEEKLNSAFDRIDDHDNTL